MDKLDNDWKFCVITTFKNKSQVAGCDYIQNQTTNLCENDPELLASEETNVEEFCICTRDECNIPDMGEEENKNQNVTSNATIFKSSFFFQILVLIAMLDVVLLLK